MSVKRGHMVSKGYIRAWADRRNVVEVIDIQDRRGFPTSINDATVVSYVYDPEVLAHDLEMAYSHIEDVGIPVMVKLREGGHSLTDTERDSMIAFLDMHLNRGRYADQTKLRAPALVLKSGGEVEKAELHLGDVLLLSQSHPEVTTLRTLGLGLWEWKVWPVEGLVTGDGAVLLWGSSPKNAEICTVTFPISPTQLLVIGRDLPDGMPMNDRIASNSRRWIVGSRGSLNLDWADATNV